jgi:hypothetical protein
MVAIILEMMAASVATVATGIKEVGQLSSCLVVLLYVRHHLSFQSTSNRWWKDSVFGINKFGPAKGVTIG